jgi:hypothetical protein
MVTVFSSCRYNEEMELEDAIHTAILTLKASPARLGDYSDTFQKF